MPIHCLVCESYLKMISFVMLFGAGALLLQWTGYKYWNKKSGLKHILLIVLSGIILWIAYKIL